MSDRENKRKCFKCGASPAEDSIKLFRFLKPGVRNLLRCEQWVKYMFPERNVSSVEFIKKLYNEHRMLCERHFKDEDFTDSTRKSLLRTAVPCDAEPKLPITFSKDQSGIDTANASSIGSFQIDESINKGAEGISDAGAEGISDADAEGIADAEAVETLVVESPTEPTGGSKQCDQQSNGKEAGPFSWQKFQEDVVTLDEKQCTDEVKFVSKAQLVPDLCDPEEIQTQTGLFSCNVCNELITGFRYACVQCPNFDVCGACEARGEHATHYVLRIPANKLHTETQTVLAALRQLLEGFALHGDSGAAVIKDEVKSEDPLGDDEAPLELSEVLTDVADTGQASEQKQPPDTGDPAASEDETYEAEYLESESEASIEMVEDTDPITNVPTETVPAARQKRKLLYSDCSPAIPQKVLIHNDQSFLLNFYHKTRELTLVEMSKVPESVPTLTQDFSAVQGEIDDSVAPQIETNDVIELQVDKNATIAPHTETTDLKLNTETGRFTITNKPKENENLLASQSHTVKCYSFKRKYK